MFGRQDHSILVHQGWQWWQGGSGDRVAVVAGMHLWKWQACTCAVCMLWKAPRVWPVPSRAGDACML